MTRVRELLARGTEQLGAAGIDSAALEARLLLEHCLGLGRNNPLPTGALDPATVEAYEQALLRRAAREPLQYIVGRAPFRYLELAVGPGVFIPRPETELLVDFVLPSLRAVADPVVVDLCAGSGALALSVAHEVPAAMVVAVELSPDALPWLRRNAAGTGVTVVAADVTDLDVPAELAALRGRADVVLSNPPYVPSDTRVDPEVRADPDIAVFAGPDGLAVLPAVIARAAELLKPGGVVALEHDESHPEPLARLLAATGDWHEVRCERDLPGRMRYTLAIRR